MRFVALTAFQGVLLLMATAGTIIALYFLKHRRRQIVISSTQLWKRVLENRLENSLFEKLRRHLSILLAVTIGLLIALAITRPQIDWLTGKTRQAVIVLDTSPTMLARTQDGKSRWQHAVDTATSLMQSASGTTQFRLADTSGQFDSPFTSNRTELRKLLDRMRPVIAPSRFPDIDKSDDADLQATFITDGVSALTVPKGTQSILVFEDAANVGITAFEIRSIPTAPLAYEGYLEVFNAGKTERSIEITISGAGQQRIAKNVKIGSGQAYKEALDLSVFDGGGIRAALRSEGDAFSPDDVAFAYLPVRRRTKTLLVTRGNKFLENALKLDRLVELSVAPPDAYNGGRDFDALVFDRFAPDELPSRPALIIGTPAASWLPRTAGSVGQPRFETWTETHPVMQHVSLYDVSIDKAVRVDASNLAVLAAYRTDLPLIIASENPRWLQLTFDLQSSDLPYHAGFPVFLDNAIAWFGRERLALRRAPGTIELPLTAAEVRTIDGRSLPTQEGVSGTIFEAEEPGLYVASSGDARQYVAVNFANRDFSNINNSPKRNDAEIQRAGVSLLRRELWVYLLSVAALLIAAEWFTYHRRITV
jgi:hypothetical protein